MPEPAHHPNTIPFNAIVFIEFWKGKSLKPDVSMYPEENMKMIVYWIELNNIDYEIKCIMCICIHFSIHWLITPTPLTIDFT